MRALSLLLVFSAASLPASAGAQSLARRLSDPRGSFAAPARAPEFPVEGARGESRHVVRFETEAERIRLHVRRGTRRTESERVVGPDVPMDHYERVRYARLCELPCTYRVAPARYSLAFSHGDDEPIALPDALEITADTTLDVSWEDNSLYRITGNIVGILGSGVGLAIGVPSFVIPFAESVPLGDGDWAGVIAGGAIFAISIVVGVVLAKIEDVFSATPRE